MGSIRVPRRSQSVSFPACPTAFGSKFGSNDRDLFCLNGHARQAVGSRLNRRGPQKFRKGTHGNPLATPSASISKRGGVRRGNCVTVVARAGSLPSPSSWRRPPSRPRASPCSRAWGAALDARYCEYRSQKALPSSISTLAVVTNSSSEHPRTQPSHCLCLPRSSAHASPPANTLLPSRAFTPALMPSAPLLLGSEVRCRQSSKCLQMFFGLLHAV